MRMVVCIGARLRIIHAVPFIFVTGCYVISSVVMLAYCEVKSVGAGTAVVVGIVVCIYTSICVADFVP